MFDAKFCEIICIRLKVMLQNVTKNVTSVTLFPDIFTWLWISKWP